MAMSKNWYIKVQNPTSRYQITLYEDGRVFGQEKNQKICVLNDSVIAEIRELVELDLPIIRSYGYHVQEHDGFIVKFWNNASSKDRLKVRGWRFAQQVVRMIFKKDNFKRLFVREDDLIAIAEEIYAIPSEVCSDEEE